MALKEVGPAVRVPSRYERFGKPLFDAVAALLVFIVLLPILFVAGVLIVVDDGLPFVFRQRRVGAAATTFTLLKLRTMKKDTPELLSTMAQPDMITRVGGILRRTNLDEVPQLVNVLRGDMSIVGPRPALPSQAALLGLRAETGVSALRPGLTGLAQINSYDGMSDVDKARYDAIYAETISLALDIRILFRTLGYLLHQPPVY